MPSYYSDKVYRGSEAIVVAMDIGTTQSAVSFAHFTPGIHPKGQMVTHWPGQAHWRGAAKTPSMVSYRDGKVKACGADALHDFEEYQENVAYWFKLHLHPTSISNSSESGIPPLPLGITIERVYADMMGYLMKHTQDFFEITTPKGAQIWARLRDGIVIVLTTPNAWDIREQVTLRKAAIMASLVKGKNAGHLLQFVSEGEASAHYALANQLGKWLKARTVFAVIDCGGSTVDTTVYRCVSTLPVSLNEVCPSECVQAGGIFVDREFRKMLEKKLKATSFNNPEVFQSILDAFEREVKPKFNGAYDEYNLKFGVITDNDASLGIYKGRITLSNQELKPLFDAAIDKIITSCLNTLIRQKAEYVLIVGGFGESPYLQKILTDRLTDMQIVPVGDSAMKAAAEGTIIGHIKQVVVTRVAKATFGGCVRQSYDNDSHHERRHADDKAPVDGAFHVWITKGAVLQGTFTHTFSYRLAWDTMSPSESDLVCRLGNAEIEVFSWEHSGTPTRCKDEHGVILAGMRPVCILRANLSTLARGLQIKTEPREKEFYQVDYEVSVYFGGTQLHAKLHWREGSLLRESPVKVLPYVT